jgi:hypothetical protein
MVAASKVGDVVRNNKWIIINALGIGVIGAMIGVPIAGMLTPFLGPVLAPVAAGGITIAIIPVTIMSGFIKKVGENDINLRKKIVEELTKISELVDKKDDNLPYLKSKENLRAFYVSELGSELFNYMADNAPMLDVFNDFVFLDSLIKGSENPFEEFYFKICFEVMKSYAKGEVSWFLKSIFKTNLQMEQTNRPLPVTYISKVLGMGRAYLTDLFQRSDRDARTRPFITLKTFASKMQPSLRKAFGEDIANDLIGDYLKGEGSRFYMLYLLYKLLCDKTNKFFSTRDFSKIMFGNMDKASVLMRTPTPAIRDLDQMWTLEYMVTHIRANPRLGFDPDAGTLNEIMSGAKKIVREGFVSQLPESLSPVVVIMVLESLHALSDKKGSIVSLADLSIVIDRFGSKLFLTSKVFGAGRNPHDDVVKTLLYHLIGEGVSRDSMAVQFTEMFLHTRGLAYID